MGWALLAAILGFIAVIISIALPYVDRVSVADASGFGIKVLTGAVVNALLVLVVVAGALALVQYLLFGRSFATLASVDPRFRTPSRLSWVAVVGIAIAIGSAAWILYQAGQLAACANYVTPIPSSCIHVGPLVAGAGLIAVGAILALVGIIGIWLGLWRLGTRYGTVLFKIGMVLSIFPYLNLIGTILIFIAAWNVRKRAMSCTVPGTISGA